MDSWADLFTLQSLIMLLARYWPGQQPLQDSTSEIRFAAHWHGCWQISEYLLPSSLTWLMAASRPSWLLAGDISFFPCRPLHSAAHSRSTGFPQSRQARPPKTEATAFCNLLISEVTWHRFCHILFKGSKSLGPAYTQGEGMTQGVNTRRQVILEAAYQPAMQSVTGCRLLKAVDLDLGWSHPLQLRQFLKRA